MITPNSTFSLGFDDPALMVNVRPRRKGRTRHIKQTDLMAGAGGATTGSELAYYELGKPVEIVAINHDITCIQTQELNHPKNLNLCTGVDRVHPEHLYRDEVMDALWASPVCTHLSSARGGTPVNPQLRASFSQVIRWVRKKRPLVFWVENVRELRSNGPVMQIKDKQGFPLFLINKGSAKKTKWIKTRAPIPKRPKGTSNRRWWADMAKLGYVPAFRPDPKRKAEYYKRDIRKLRALGYDVEDRDCDCADFGAATGRKRLFIYGVRRDCGMKIVWPKGFCAKPDENGRLPPGMFPRVPAAVGIDFSNLGGSIFTRDRALKRKSIKRIIAGLIKYGIHPYIVPGKGTDGDRVRDVLEPAQTITTTSRGEAVVTPFLKPQPGEPGLKLPPFITPGFGERKGQTPRTHRVDEVAPVICAQGHMHLAQPYLVKYRGTNDACSIHESAPALTANGTHLALVEPFLVQTSHGKTNDTSDASARSKSVREPIGSVCGNRGDWALTNAFVTQVSHGVDKTEKNPENRRVRSLAEPLGAVTGSNDWALTHVSFLLSQQSGGVPRHTADVAPTIATTGAIHLVTTSVPASKKAKRQKNKPRLNAAMKKLARDIMKYALRPNTGYPEIEIDGQTYPLDIFHRMLDVPELSIISSFPAFYRFAGNKTQKIRQIGNAVPPLMARALVKAFWSQNPDVGPPPPWEVLHQRNQLQAA